jgi:threonylcarbamoyladenosine tRNA methylthiotransferase MtaB
VSTGVRVAFVTLGCRLNQVDTQQLQTLLEARGFRPVAGPSADVVVVNTCAVTARAELSDRQAIRRARRSNPRARVVVTGCWAQTDPVAIARLGEVDLIVGNADKSRLPELLDGLLATPARTPRIEVGDVARATLEPVAPRPHAGARARAFVKVQDGCQHRCAFCIVPAARGASRSLAPGMVEDHVRRLVEAGHPEVVLTGVDLGHYGADRRPRTSLAALLERLVQVRGLRWLRLSSLLPSYFTEDLLQVVTTSPVIAPHFHVPLQSGSDRVLRLMRRPYTTALYRRVVERLAAAIPRLGLGADVIAGFPGETEADFAATVELLERGPFSYLHVFPYSARPATAAMALPDRVDSRLVGERARRLREIGAERARRFRASLVGGLEEVLVLERGDRASGELTGLTGNYVEVAFAGPDGLRGTLARVRVTAAGEAGARGVLADTLAA